MDISFYTAALGAGSQQMKLNTIANNLANVNNNGYKSKNAVFSDLMYYNLNNRENVDTDLKSGVGIRVEQVNTNFDPKGFQETGKNTEYAIVGKGFFMLSNPTTQEITYTRSGNFSLSLRGNQWNLVSDTGKLVLDRNRQPIVMGEDGKTVNGEDPDIGIFEFAQKNGMESIGDNEYRPIAKNGQPVLTTESKLKQGALENPGVDVGMELARIIESQRAYSMALKMVQTSDEITATFNTLR